MSSLLGDVPRLISLPHRVHWCGFVATTRDLQRMGWQISAEQDFGRTGIRLAMRNEDAQMFAVTDTVDFTRLAMFESQSGRGMYPIPGDRQTDPRFLDFHIRYMGSGLHVRYVDANPFKHFSPIDAQTQMIRTRVDALEDLCIFAPPLAQTKEIIVDEAEVSSILAKLIEAQRPEQERIRARQRLRESREGMELGAEPRRKFHAQILSIAAQVLP